VEPDHNDQLFETFWTQQKCPLRSEGQMAHLIQAIQEGQTMAVSDGTFKDQAGAAAWTIEGRTADN